MIYTDGTVAIKAGSPIVTGTGTQWKKNIHGVAPGQLICIENGTAPVSMMIRAVNSDTELVLSFNAPVTLSGAKYSIATTVPDTISDAARTMSANQGYIVYFLRAMQQWMTDTGQVEIELPNGQKVTLESIRALTEKMKDLLSYSSHLVTGGVDSSGNGSVNFAGGMGRVYRTKAGVITIYSRPDGNGSGYTTSFHRKHRVQLWELTERGSGIISSLPSERYSLLLRGLPCVVRGLVHRLYPMPKE
ncbi:hypothetical protein N0392_03580 [Morganella morganii]|uniref:Uncharacterized protein n=1 Tax=Morganella morganii TaxID=582 RepID=A0A9Q4CM21_MORMO|nr:hypothetical protein [Morganella morganii]MCY0788769.1 hypothetical protein [Morganella morganii]